jgi:hypothetical protein
MWWSYLFMLMFGVVSVMLANIFSPRPGTYVAYMLISFLIGCQMADMQKEILARPFSFCLPGHRQAMRQFIFWCGGILNAISGLVFLAYPGLGLGYGLLVVMAGGCAGMLIYFWGMYLSFMEKPAITGISILVIGLALVFYRLDRAVQHIIISWPLLMIAAGALACVCAWKWLGRDCLPRRYCGKLLVSDSFGAGNRPKAQRLVLARAYTRPGKIRAAILRRVDTFFLTAIANVNLVSLSRHILAAAYILAGRFLATYRLRSLLGLLSMVLFFVLYFGYMSVPGISCLFYSFCAFPLIGLKLVAHPTLLLPEGRHEKYYRAIASAAIATIVGAAVLIPVTAVSMHLENILPAITLGEHTFTYHAMDIRQFYNYLLFVPIALALTMVFRRNFFWRIFAIAFLVPFSAFFAFAGKVTPIDRLGPMPIIGLVLLFWLLFLLFLHRHCTKKPLVGQTKQY